LQILVFSFYHYFIVALGQFVAQEYIFLCCLRKLDSKNVNFALVQGRHFSLNYWKLVLGYPKVVLLLRETSA